MKKIAISLLLLSLIGCATRPISNFEAKPVPPERLLNSNHSEKKPDTTKVTVKRDTGIFGSACPTQVFLNAGPLAELNTGEKVEIFLLAGDYILSAWPKGVCGGGMSETKLNLIKDKAQSFRIGYGSNGDFYLNPTAF